MNAIDAEDFGNSWDQCAELYGKSVSSSAKEMAFKLLARYPLSQIKAALQAHMLDPDNGRFMPRPADVVNKIRQQADGQFPGAEEAWAKFPRDESQSACICNEMAIAWGVACAQDEISGRMTFKEIYNREVAKSQASGQPPKWFVSMGSDREQRQQVTLDAVATGQLSAQQAHVYLPHIPASEIEPVANRELSPHQLLENHAQTVTSLDQLFLSAPDEALATNESNKAHVAKLRELLHG